MDLTNILTPSEIECFVQELRPSKILSIGDVTWFEEHLRLERLRQQCIAEAVQCVEERVKDFLILEEKLPILIYEAIIIQCWREKVFESLKAVEKSSNLHGFIGYMILYHECTAISLLQIVLHHRDVVQGLQDSCIDLIDYCASQIAQLCSQASPAISSDDLDDFKKLVADQTEIQYNIGLVSIAVFASLGEYLDDLGVSCVSRLYDTHDIPLLMSSLIESQPWKRYDSKANQWTVFNDGSWLPWDFEKISKSEAQCWLALRGLLLHTAAHQHYEITDFRKHQLIKVQKYLHERVIDQISPLIELKQFLSQLMVCNPNKTAKTPIIIECMPQIRTSLMAKTNAWKKLTEKHMSLIFNGDRTEIVEIAKRVAETYDQDKMASIPQVEVKSDKLCQLCGKSATKRCSRCHATWYCRRECQVKAWPTHKVHCQSI